jgi:hypothetical protein
MITADQVIPLFLEASPSFAPAWQRYTEEASYEPGLLYIDLGELSRHLIELWRAKNSEELRAAFSVADRLILEGDDYVKQAATIGLLEGLQNNAGHQGIDPEVFRPMLGSESVRWWDGLNKFWSGKAPGVMRQ